VLLDEVIEFIFGVNLLLFFKEAISSWLAPASALIVFPSRWGLRFAVNH